MANNFTPPVQHIETVGKNQGPEGHISSISLLLTDANARLFSLHVATEANFLVTYQESVEPTEPLEPVFMVPAASITDTMIDHIVHGVSPLVLDLYLVEQTD